MTLDGFAALSRLVHESVTLAIGNDPDPSDPFRGLYITDEHAGSLAAEGVGALPDDRLDELAERLELDELDMAIIGLVAAPEVVPGYGRLYAYLHDDVTRKLVSVGLVARLLGTVYDPRVVRDRLASDAPLRRSGAVRVSDESGDTPVQDRPLRVADAVAGFLVGAPIGRATPIRHLGPTGSDGEAYGRDAAVARMRDHLVSGRAPLVVHGPDATALVVRAAPHSVAVVAFSALRDPVERQEIQLLARLHDAVLCIEGLADVTPDDRSVAVATLDALRSGYVISDPRPGATRSLSGRPVVVIEVPEPTVAERAAAWAWYSGVDEIDVIAATYRLSITQIHEACDLAADLALSAGEAYAAAHLGEAARQVSAGNLDELATRLPATYTWDQLILPERPLAMLRSIFGFLRHRDRVLSDWGYAGALAQNQGLKVLFSGDSGTGKTMAARVLARELGLEIYRVDLATTVSKYIGETEKNLDRIFTAAEGSNAIVFFDEADAVFGKRSDVGDAHDRYANLETAYLLQRMESYPGAVILATNYRNNIDDAFLRRLDVIIDFPFPDEDDRKRIWQVALPASAPVAADLDLDFLATRFSLSGGGIRNASLAGAFLAAEAEDVIRMEHLVQGVANEYAKLGRLTMASDFGRFHDLVTGASATAASGDADAWALSSRPGTPPS